MCFWIVHSKQSVALATIVMHLNNNEFWIVLYGWQKSPFANLLWNKKLHQFFSFSRISKATVYANMFVSLTLSLCVFHVFINMILSVLRKRLKDFNFYKGLWDLLHVEVSQKWFLAKWNDKYSTKICAQGF